MKQLRTFMKCIPAPKNEKEEKECVVVVCVTMIKIFCALYKNKNLQNYENAKENRKVYFHATLFERQCVKIEYRIIIVWGNAFFFMFKKKKMLTFIWMLVSKSI